MFVEFIDGGITRTLGHNDLIAVGDVRKRLIDATPSEREAVNVYPLNRSPVPTNTYHHVAESFALVGGEVLASYVLTPRDVDALKDQRKGEVNAIRESKKWEPISHTGHEFDADEGSSFNLTATITAVAGGMVLPAGFAWRAADNALIPMTSDELKALGNALLARNNGLYVTSWTHKAAIDALTTAEEVIAYDIGGGW